MKPILYSKSETKFTSIGYGTLSECTSCYCEEERNGIFEVTFKYPTSGRLYSFIQEDCFIKVKANDKQGPQIFRIYGSSKEINGEQEFYCEHITYRLNRIPLIGANIKNKSASEAMNQLKSESLVTNPFVFESDIDSVLSTEIKVPVSVRKALGGIEGSILDKWGGEYEWDNMTVKLHKMRGDFKDLPIKYGLNLQKLSKKKMTDVVYTSVLPYLVYTDDESVEHKVTLSEKYLTYEGLNPKEISVYVKDFSDQFSDEEPKTEEALRAKCKQWMQTNKLYMPSISLSVEIVKLEQTEEYKDLLKLQSVNLCDYVPVVFEDLNVSEKIQVIKIKYDCLLERNDTIELGDKVSTLNEQVQNNSNSNSIVIDKVTQSYLDAIKNATDLITGNKGGHVVFRPGVRPEEILIMDTDNINTAKNVWRWNQSGLGHSSNGYNGPFDVAMTMDGQIVAKFIAAGILTGMQINGSVVNGATINGSNINGGTIKSGTTIDVATDLKVGNNIYVGSYNDRDTQKNIYLNDKFYIYSRNNMLALGIYNGDYFEGKLFINGAGECNIKGPKIKFNGGNDITLTSGKTIRMINGKGGEISFWNDSGAFGGYFTPSKAGNSAKITLGTTTYPWHRLYAQYDVSVISDMRQKTNIGQYDKRFEDMYMELKPVTYELKDELGQKHFGLVAQWVEKVMDKYGIGRDEFGALIYENGLYSICYSEFITLNMHMIQKAFFEIEKCKKEVAKLKSIVEQLDTKINSYINGSVDKRSG